MRAKYINDKKTYTNKYKEIIDDDKIISSSILPICRNLSSD